MYEDLTWKDKLRREYEKIKEMDPKKRWNYFVSYYLWMVVIVIALIAMAIHLVYDMKMSFRDVEAAGCLVNIAADPQTEDFLTDEYLAECGLSPKKSVAYLTYETTEFLKDNPVDQDSYEMALNAQLCAGQYSYMIMDEAGLEHFESLDVYADVEKVLSETQKEKTKDCLVYREQDGKQHAVAISLKDTGFVENYHLNPQETYLVFVDVDMDIAKNQKFFDYIWSVKER